MDVDSALAQVGGWKRWNLFMYFLVGTAMSLPLSWQDLSIVFVGESGSHDVMGINNVLCIVKKL